MSNISSDTVKGVPALQIKELKKSEAKKMFSVKGNNVKMTLLDAQGNNTETKIEVPSGKNLEKLGLTKDNKNFKVKYMGKEYSILPTDVTPIKPKEIAKKESPKNPVEVKKQEEKPAAEQAQKDFKDFDEAKRKDIVESMFDKAGLNDAKIKEYVDGLPERILKGETLTYEEIDKNTGYDIKDFFLSRKKHGFKYADKKGNLDINEAIKDYQAKADAVALANTFIGSIVKGPTPEQLAYADNAVITSKEAEMLGISSKLFDLIDSGMVVGGKGDGKITLGEIKKFNETIDKYAEAFGIDREKAIDLYKMAPCFEMVDLDAVIETGKDVQENGVGGIKITGKTSFDELQKHLKPEIYKVISDKYQGKMVGDNVQGLCKLLASLPLISRFDAKTQKDVFGIDATKTSLPKFEDEINKENILKYMKKETAEKKEVEVNPEKKEKSPDPATKAVEEKASKATVVVADDKAKSIFGKYKADLVADKSIAQTAWDNELKQLAGWATAAGRAKTEQALGQGAYSIIKNKVIDVL